MSLIHKILFLWLALGASFGLVAPAMAAEAFPEAFSLHGYEVKCLWDAKGWTWMAPDRLFSVEAQTDGRILLAGGPFGVFLLKEEKGSWRQEWDWEFLGLKNGDVVCAVAAERNPYGRVNLVLAAEPGKKRIFLAEARSHEVKIRWQHTFLLPPRVVRLCPDTGNFLVLSYEEGTSGASIAQTWRLEEMDFRLDKTVWGFGGGAGTLRPADVLRLKNGWTILSDLASGRLAAFDRKGKKIWVQGLVAPESAPLKRFPLALERKGAKGTVLAALTGVDGTTQWVRVATATGKVLGRWTSAPQGGVEAPIPATDDLSVVMRVRAAAP